MKIFIICLILSLALSLESKAESDTYINQMRNGIVEKIEFSQIQKPVSGGSYTGKNYVTLRNFIQNGAYYYEVRFGNGVRWTKMIFIGGGK